MDSKLVVHPKDYKLKCSEDVLKTLNPYFELSSSTYSHYSNSQSHQITNGHSSDTNSQPKQETKTTIHLSLRDANSGELLGKGTLVYDDSNTKPEKFDEKVMLKDFMGNEVGEAIVEIQQMKHHENQMSIEEELNKMKKEMHTMMKRTNKLFDNFSNKHLGRDWGFGMLDDITPMMMIGDISEDWEDSCEKCGHQQKKKRSHHGRKHKNHKTVELSKDANKHLDDNKDEKRDNVEIQEEQ